jgi:hypothetical protein
VPTRSEADVSRSCNEILSDHPLSVVLPALANTSDRQRALLHRVFTSGRQRPRKVQL